MSPDPPREDSGDDENRIRRFSGEFIEGMMNDEEFFIVPDAPYELDMEEESDYSDSDEEGGTAGASGEGGGRSSLRTGETVVVVEGEQEVLFQEGHARGRYRLLIPFPTPVTATTTEGDVTDVAGSSGGGEGGDGGGCQESNKSDRLEGEEDSLPKEGSSSSKTNQLPSGNSVDKPSSSGQEVPKREIELTEEKVEKIKEVMKGITLPPTSIPKWASEIDEDSWKKKLNDSISNPSRQVNKASSDKMPK